MKAAPKISPKRRKLLAKVHMAAKELALTEDSYRDVLLRVTGKDSAKKCGDAQLGAVVEAFKSLGWTPKRRAPPKRSGGRKLAGSPQARKIRALWLSLYHLGEVGNAKEAAIAAFILRQTGCEALEWLSPEQNNQVIEALKDWCARAGFVQPGEQRVEQIDRARVLTKRAPLGAGFAAKCRLIDVLWGKLVEAGAMRTGTNANLGTWLLKNWGVAAPQFLDAAEADQAIERLGAWLRKTTGKKGANDG